MRNRVTMPRWPAYLMGVVAAACAYPAMTTPTPKQQQERYEARGNEPGWSLRIHDDRIDFAGPGARAISVDRPYPRRIGDGRRYATPELTVEVADSRCIDDLSGRGYEHRVTVTTRGRTVRGCGGARVPGWDV